ncbi:MAG: hypothetical protein ACTSUK_07170 [Promethearchaeota archaeon]
MSLKILLFEPLVEAIFSNWVFVLWVILVVLVLIWVVYATGRTKKAAKALFYVLIYYFWYYIVDLFIMPFVSTAYGDFVYEAIRILLYIIPIAVLVYTAVFKGNPEE